MTPWLEGAGPVIEPPRIALHPAGDSELPIQAQQRARVPRSEAANQRLVVNVQSPLRPRLPLSQFFAVLACFLLIARRGGD
jgi:hypothetical protein